MIFYAETFVPGSIILGELADMSESLRQIEKNQNEFFTEISSQHLEELDRIIERAKEVKKSMMANAEWTAKGGKEDSI